MKTKLSLRYSWLAVAILGVAVHAPFPAALAVNPCSMVESGSGELTCLSPEHGSPLRLSHAAKLNVTPRGFIPNVGQLANESVKFTLRDSGTTAHFTDQGFVLWNGHTTTITRDGIGMTLPVAPRWSLMGARRVDPVGGDAFKHTVSFFRGNDPAKWRPNVPAYRDLRYPGVLDGVELRVESREDGFEYSFHIQPHAKPNLHFRYDGITGLETSSLGNLIVRTDHGHFTESRPIAFQWIHGVKHEVASSFELVSASEYRIAVGDYDEHYELVVDPVLDWSTFMGASYNDNIRDVKVDPDGNLCVTGGTTSEDLLDTASFSTGPGDPFSNDHQDVYAAQFNSTGTELLWLGYLAGAGATEDSVGYGSSLALDSAGNLHIVGFTESPDFPEIPTPDTPSHAGGRDVFITKISSTGSAILRSSLLGGTSDDYGWGIGLDALENVLLTGFTTSGDFSVDDATFDGSLGGGQDAFVAKVDNSSGTLLWWSFLGGDNGAERGAAIVADANGDILVTGDTESSDFPVTPDAWDEEFGGTDDAFVAKIRSDGAAILWATFVGGSGMEHDLIEPFSTVVWPRGDLALDSAGNILIAGHTLSVDFPVTDGAFQETLAGDADGYVAKLTPDGASLIWASYLGGSGGDQYQEIIWGIALNPWDEVFLIGRTDSPNFPVTPDAVQTSFPGGFQDGFLTRLSANGSSLLYSTFLGGSQNRDVALGITYDSGNVFVSGWAASASYPITAGTYQSGCFSCGNGYSDAVLLKFLDAYIAHDGFESGNYAGGQEGWTGNWTATGDTSLLTSSGPHSGSRHVRLRSSTGYLKRTIALPPATTTAQLAYWAKVNSFESSDRAHVMISSNGVTWTTVRTFTPSDSNNTYRFYEEEIPADFLGTGQLHIAFDAAMNASNDHWFLDDIRLTGTAGSVPPVADAGVDQTVTDTDGDGFATVTLNGSGSIDPDGGGIVSYEWKEGETVLGTDAMISPTLAQGTHTIALTVTDDEEDTDNDDVVIRVIAAPPLEMHCVLSASKTSQGSKWRATVTVMVHNASEQLVSGAAVDGTWTGGYTGPFNSTTGTGGQVSFTTGWMQKSSASSVTFMIDDVQHSSLQYNASDNHNGTSITVTKP